MGLTALKGKKSKKKTIRSKARTGLAGVPVEKGFDAVKEYFHLEVDKKDCISQVKAWVKKNFPQPAKYILANHSFTDNDSNVEQFAGNKFKNYLDLLL